MPSRRIMQVDGDSSILSSNGRAGNAMGPKDQLDVPIGTTLFLGSTERPASFFPVHYPTPQFKAKEM